MLVLFQQADLARQLRQKHIINMGGGNVYIQKGKTLRISDGVVVKNVKTSGQGKGEYFEGSYTNKP